MGFLAPIAGIVSGIAGVAGTIMQVSAAKEEGREQQARFNYEQKVASQQADEAEAASQRDAASRYKEGKYLASRQRAAIAGSGGDLSDASVIDVMGDTAEATAFAADTDIYKGQQQARGYNDAAKVATYNADASMRAARANATAALFSGVSSMFSRFGQQAKKTDSAATVKLPYGGAAVGRG